MAGPGFGGSRQMVSMSRAQWVRIAARLAIRALVLGVTVAAVAGCDRSGAASPATGDRLTLLVSAAASLSEAIGAVADRFEEEQGVRILLNVAGSQMLASQIIEGAPVDVFVSADMLQMERALAAGRIDAARRVNLLSNQLVVVVPSDRTGAVTAPRDLADPSIRRIALGDTEAVPAGVYARRYLESQGLWDALASRIVPAGSVRAALRAVEAGTVDAGIVYRTDVRSSAGAVIAFAVPAEDGPSIVYPAAVAAAAPNPAAAARFLAYLASPEARRRFDEAGFISLPPAGGPPAESAG